MGNPTIYYYPDPEGTLEVLDFGEPLSDLQITQVREVADSYSRGGSFYRTTGASRLQIRIILENFTSASLVRQFESLSAHLERGGAIGFALDPDTAWGSFVNVPARAPVRGSVALQTKGHKWSGWTSAAALDSGDEISVSTPSPEGMRETRLLSSATSSTGSLVSILGDELNYTHGGDVVLVRQRDFYPCLTMPASSVGVPILETNHRISYTLDLTLEEDWGTLVALAQTSAPLRDTSGLPTSGASLAQALEDYRASLNDAWISTT
jgi:hypothetical protein